MRQHRIGIPILPSRSLSKTLVFYRQLGFEGRIRGVGDDPDGNLLRIGQAL